MQSGGQRCHNRVSCGPRFWPRSCPASRRRCGTVRPCSRGLNRWERGRFRANASGVGAGAWAPDGGRIRPLRLGRWRGGLRRLTDLRLPMRWSRRAGWGRRARSQWPNGRQFLRRVIVERGRTRLGLREVRGAVIIRSACALCCAPGCARARPRRWKHIGTIGIGRRTILPRPGALLMHCGRLHYRSPGGTRRRAVTPPAGG
jgi:hypothetical protein